MTETTNTPPAYPSTDDDLPESVKAAAYAAIQNPGAWDDVLRALGAVIHLPKAARAAAAPSTAELGLDALAVKLPAEELGLPSSAITRDVMVKASRKVNAGKLEQLLVEPLWLLQVLNLVIVLANESDNAGADARELVAYADRFAGSADLFATALAGAQALHDSWDSPDTGWRSVDKAHTQNAAGQRTAWRECTEQLGAVLYPGTDPTRDFRTPPAAAAEEASAP